MLQAGFTMRAFDEEWGNFEWDQDDHFEELWSKGEAGIDLDSFSQSPIVLEPDHYQSLFLIMGCLYSVGLIFLLWDILNNPLYELFDLMIAGLSSCLLVTIGNLFFLSTALWTPITYDTTQLWYYDTRYQDYNIKIPERTITTGFYEYDMKMLVKNRTTALAILWYGAVTSIIFIFLAMIRSLGKTHFLSM